VVVPQQATVSGGMGSLKKNTKKRKLPMKQHVRPKNLKTEYLLGDWVNPTAQQML
jgi:hypothetical protein